MPPKKKARLSSSATDLMSIANESKSPVKSKNSLKRIASWMSARSLSKRIVPESVTMANPADHNHAITDIRIKKKPKNKLPKKSALKTFNELKIPLVYSNSDLTRIATLLKDDAISCEITLNLKKLCSDLVAQRLAIRRNNSWDNRVLAQLYTFVSLMSKERLQYAPIDLDNFFKESRLCILVIKGQCEARYIVLPDIIHLIEAIIGKVPILNSPFDLPPALANVAPGDESKARREYLFSEEEAKDIHPEVSSMSLVKASDLFRAVAADKYYLSYSDGDSLPEPQDLQVDHLQPESNIRKRLNEFTEAMNADEYFANNNRAIALETGFVKTTRGWELTPEVIKKYCNYPDNLWLIRTSTNLKKSDMDALDYLEINAFYGTKFFLNNSPVSKDCILYTINGEALAKVAKEYFREQYLLTLKTSQVLEKAKISLRRLAIEIDDLPEEHYLRKAANNTTVNIQSVLFFLEQLPDIIDERLTKRIEGTAESSTISTKDIPGKSKLDAERLEQIFDLNLPMGDDRLRMGIRTRTDDNSSLTSSQHSAIISL